MPPTQAYNRASDIGESRPSVPRNEVFQCEREVAMCLFHLKDEERKKEARGYLRGNLEGPHSWEAELSPQARVAIEKLLEEEDYFAP